MYYWKTINSQPSLHYVLSPGDTHTIADTVGTVKHGKEQGASSSITGTFSVSIPKLKEPGCNSMVLVSVLIAVGDLCKVVGTIMKGYVVQLLPILLEFLLDASSSQKRGFSVDLVTAGGEH